MDLQAHSNPIRRPSQYDLWRSSVLRRTKTWALRIATSATLLPPAQVFVPFVPEARRECFGIELAWHDPGLAFVMRSSQHRSDPEHLAALVIPLPTIAPSKTCCGRFFPRPLKPSRSTLTSLQSITAARRPCIAGPDMLSRAEDDIHRPCASRDRIMRR
jgi:hypothetical protein